MTPLPPKQGLKPFPRILRGISCVELWHHFHQNKDWNVNSWQRRKNEYNCYDTTSTKTRIETAQTFGCREPCNGYDTTSTKTRIETRLEPEMHQYKFVLWHHFHQNKDWNCSALCQVFHPWQVLWHHFHQNKDWNPVDESESADRIAGYDTTSTKTRIETMMKRKTMNKYTKLWHHFHQNKDWNFLSRVDKCGARSYDTTSTKTRIETWQFAAWRGSEACYDTTSTKTRIETKKLPHCW